MNRCKHLVYDKNTKRTRKCKHKTNNKYCKQHLKNQFKMKNNYSEDSLEQEYGECCFCGDYCNPLSQSCGGCSRTVSMYGLQGLKNFIS
jgi:hypothetical protein